MSTYRMSSPRRQPLPQKTERPRGFTLMEMMVVIALLAIFSAIALPSFSSLVQANRVQSSANEFMSLLQSARADAVTLRTTLTACAASDGSGWMVVQADSCSASATVRARATLASGVNLSSTVSSLSFAADGSAAAAEMSFSSARTDNQFLLKVEPAGFMSLNPGSSG